MYSDAVMIESNSGRWLADMM